MNKILKVLKITSITFFILLVGFYIAFVQFTNPKSNKEVLKKYENSIIKPVISYDTLNGLKYRKISLKTNDTLPTLVFVHGTVGSLNDFNKYLSDSLLQSKFNMLAYDRIGYNFNDKNPVQESIALERLHLQQVLKSLPKNKTILIGYSYGGPIVLSIKERVKKVILLAPAVYSKVEPMPWIVKLYKYNVVRWFVSYVWQQAAKEKMSHPKDLQNFESNWKTTPNKITAIHGTADWIAPLSNSEFLERQFSKEQFKLIRLKNVGHGLVWSNFNQIKKYLVSETK